MLEKHGSGPSGSELVCLVGTRVRVSVHTTPNKPNYRGKHSRVRLKWTKQLRNESTLKPAITGFLVSNWLVSFLTSPLSQCVVSVLAHTGCRASPKWVLHTGSGWGVIWSPLHTHTHTHYVKRLWVTSKKALYKTYLLLLLLFLTAMKSVVSPERIR